MSTGTKVSFKKRLISAYGWFNREWFRIIRLWNQVVVGPFFEGIMMVVLFGVFISTGSCGPSGGVSASLPKSLVMSGLFGGVIGMILTRNAFQATSSPLVISKMAGFVTDYTALPFATTNLKIGTLGGSIARCLLTLGLCLASMPIFGVKAFNIWLTIPVTIITAINFGLIGLMVGTVCSTFEQSATINSYIIAPLSMLSGTFVPVQQLPEVFQKISLFNPFFYSVDLMRYCMTGVTFLGLKKELLIFTLMIPIFWFVTGIFAKRFVHGRIGN